jgi:hypothetical protein
MSELSQSRATVWNASREKPVSKRIARLILELSEKKRARKRAGMAWTEVVSDGA